MNKLKLKSYPLYFCVPALAVYIVIGVLPNFMAVGYSFTNWNFARSDIKFVGLRNYLGLFNNSGLGRAIYNTVLFTVVSTAAKMVFAILLAFLLNRKTRTTKFTRTVFYMPAVINTVAVGITFAALMHPSRGLINNALGLNINWLTDPKIEMLSIAGIETWKWSGYTMMIPLAGMQSVPHEYYEAADIDGASAFQKATLVTLPLIRPAINNVLILSIIGGLKVFDIVLSTVGSKLSTSVINTFVYRGFSSSLYGEACAGIVILAVMIMALTLPTYRIISQKEVSL